MTDQEAPPPAGHNNPPSPIDETLAPFRDHMAEAENWLDGEKVTTEKQMKAVDDLLKEIKAADKALSDAEEAAAKPLYRAWQDEKAKWKADLADLGRMKKGLASLVSAFKVELAEKKEEERRKAQAEARRKEEEARKAVEKAQGDIEAQRAADAALEEAKEARKAAPTVAESKVKGLRTVVKHEVTDHKALLHWIARNRRDDLTAFLDEWARRNYRDNRDTEGLRVWEEKEAY